MKRSLLADSLGRGIGEAGFEASVERTAAIERESSGLCNTRNEPGSGLPSVSITNSIVTRPVMPAATAQRRSTSCRLI